MENNDLIKIFNENSHVTYAYGLQTKVSNHCACLSMAFVMDDNV